MGSGTKRSAHPYPYPYPYPYPHLRPRPSRSSWLTTSLRVYRYGLRKHLPSTPVNNERLSNQAHDLRPTSHRNPQPLKLPSMHHGMPHVFLFDPPLTNRLARVINPKLVYIYDLVGFDVGDVCFYASPCAPALVRRGRGLLVTINC